MSAAAALLLALAPATTARVPVKVLCSADGVLEGLKTPGRQVLWADPASAGPAIRRALPDLATRIVIANDVSISYQCIGGIIYLLQREGYLHIGFIAEPPPPRRWRPTRPAGKKAS